VAFIYLKVKSAGLGLGVLFWSWSCYFGLDIGLRLKNLVLSTSLVIPRLSFKNCWL